MQSFKMENNKRAEHCFMVETTHIYNTEDKLEFKFGNFGAHWLPSETTLRFKVDVPESCVPDNFFGSKQFTDVKIFLNHTEVTQKVTDLDYPLCDYMISRQNYSEKVLESIGLLSGIYGNDNPGATKFRATNVTATGSHEDGYTAVTAFTENDEAKKRRKGAEPVTIEGKRYYRYFISLRINTGLAIQGKPIPKDTEIRIEFRRAKASFGLLSTLNYNDDENGILHTYLTHSNASLKLIDPVLHVCYIDSTYYDQKFQSHNISSFKYKYTDFNLHRYNLN